jgi:hypothetical protein
MENTQPKQEWENMGHIINDILDYRGVYDCGKCFDGDWNEKILPIIALAEQRKIDEVVGIIKKTAKTCTFMKNPEMKTGVEFVLDDLISQIKEISG